MRILVTGGAGFIGSHVVDRHIAAGHDVIVVDDLSTGRRDHVNPLATFYRVDIRARELEDVFARERPDVLSHHAAQVSVRRSTVDPIFDAEVNVIGSIHLLQCAMRHGVRKVIYSSTGGALYGEPRYCPADEEHPVAPRCEYGASKHAVEHYIRLYALNYGLDFTVLRYPNVYGPRQDPNGEAGVVAIFASRMLRGEPCTINGDGTQSRDFLFVDDCAGANEIVAGGAGSRGTYNLGTGRATDINAIFRVLARATAYPFPPIYGPATVGEIEHICLDATRAATELGWSARVDLDDGLLRTVDYFRSRFGHGVSATR